MSVFHSRSSFPRSSRSGPIALGVLAGAALVVSVPLAAIAHVGVSPSSTAAGSTSQLAFSVGHGCEGSPTTALTFTIPEEFVAVAPHINPNWTAEKVMVDLPDPITDAHGSAIAQRVGQVVYTAKVPLADGFRDTVTLQVTLPEDSDGSDIAFPVLQSCEVGETDWNQVAVSGQDPHELERPAPTVTVTGAESEHHGSVGTELAASETATAASGPSEPDLIARSLGLAGLVTGVAGILVAIIARRTTTPAAATPATPSEGHHS